mgnify:CR=1 FL=1
MKTTNGYQSAEILSDERLQDLFRSRTNGRDLLLRVWRRREFPRGLYCSAEVEAESHIYWMAWQALDAGVSA